MGGFKSDRNRFTKMRVTALIIVRVLRKNLSNRTIIKVVTRILVKSVSVTFKTAHCNLASVLHLKIKEQMFDL